MVELDAAACETLRRNRGDVWKVIEDDVANVDGRGFAGLDLFAGGVPCPPFSIAGKQLGRDDERDLFPQALRLVEEIGPRAVLLENVRGLAARRFDGYRTQVLQRLHGLGYQTWWDVVQASQHGVPQLRPRFVLVALRQPWASLVPVARGGGRAAAHGGRHPGRPDGRARLAGRGGLGGRGPGDRPHHRRRAARSTAAPTWGPPGRARRGKGWAWTGWASATTPPGRCSRWTSGPS